MKREIEIGGDENAESLHDRLAGLGAQVLLETVEAIKNGTAKREKQDDALASYASMIDKDTALIDWSKDSRSIKNLVRAMSPRPLAYTYYRGEIMKIGEATLAENGVSGENGCVLGYKKGEGLTVACGDGAVIVKSVQFSGKRMMSVDEYMQGNDIEVGTILGGL